MKAGADACETRPVGHSSFTLIHLGGKEEEEESSFKSPRFQKAKAFVDLKYEDIKFGLFLDDYFSFLNV